MASLTCRGPVRTRKLLEQGVKYPTLCSDAASSELVASSSAKILGFFSNARAIARRCLCPPLKLRRPTEQDNYQQFTPEKKVAQTFCVETLRHPKYELAVRLACSSFDLLARSILVPEGDIRCNGPREEDGVLGGYCHKSRYKFRGEHLPGGQYRSCCAMTKD